MVNNVGPTSIPGQIAAGLGRLGHVEVGMLPWFGQSAFRGMDEIQVEHVEAPDTILGINLRTAKTVRGYIGQYDIVHTHHPHSGSISKILSIGTETAVVTTEHNDHGGYSVSGRRLNGLSNPLTDRVTCVSDSVRSSFANWEGLILADSKIRTITNGIDVERIRAEIPSDGDGLEQYPVDSHAQLLGMTAMHTEQKAHDTLIHAVQRLTELGFNVELVVTGNGPLEQYLRELAETLDVAERVHFVGLLHRALLYDLLARLDLYIMPSRWEGFCVAVAEAMALNTACVLSDIDVFTELYAGAAVFHPVDDVDELVHTIQELLTDDRYRSKLAARGASLVAAEYGFDDIIDQYDRLYRQVLAEH